MLVAVGTLLGSRRLALACDTTAVIGFPALKVVSECTEPAHAIGKPSLARVRHGVLDQVAHLGVATSPLTKSVLGDRSTTFSSS